MSASLSLWLVLETDRVDLLICVSFYSSRVSSVCQKGCHQSTILSFHTWTMKWSWNMHVFMCDGYEHNDKHSLLSSVCFQMEMEWTIRYRCDQANHCTRNSIYLATNPMMNASLCSSKQTAADHVHSSSAFYIASLHSIHLPIFDPSISCIFVSFTDCINSSLNLTQTTCSLVSC